MTTSVNCQPFFVDCHVQIKFSLASDSYGVYSHHILLVYFAIIYNLYPLTDFNLIYWLPTSYPCKMLSFVIWDHILKEDR